MLGIIKYEWKVNENLVQPISCAWVIPTLQFQSDHEEHITYKQSMLYTAAVPAKIQP